MTTGVVFSEDFRRHDPGKGHPEAAGRVDAVASALRAESLAGRFERLEPRRAEREEILLLHWERLYEEICETAERDQTYLDADTVASRDSSDVAHLGVGATLQAVEAVMEGRVDNAFSLVRPPGHHAKPDKAMGFCLFNNVAVAAKYAQQRYKLSRILIVDFDVHHGNGTQKAFYTSPEVLFVSTHQWPHYPGTGALEEIGKDEGEGFTVNVPLPAGLSDAQYLSVFQELVVPVGQEFGPELLLVSAGFDGHARDPLGGFNLSEDGYAAVTSELVRLARSTCAGKSVFALEGGYDPKALEKSIVSVLSVLSGDRPRSGPAAAAEDDTVKQVVRDVCAQLGPHWTSLKR